MSYLPASKHGDCTKCPAKDTACVKVGKELICIKCNNAGKTKKQIFKAKQRNLNNLSKKVKSFAKGEDAFRVPQKYELDKWFDERMERCNATCENCGATNTNLKKPLYKVLWKSCQGHLLPKRHFKSICTHPLNGMVLGSGFSGLCHCHDDYDSSWDKASKMKIWEEVIRRFKIMLPLIPQEEQRFIPDQLLQEINQI